MMEMMTQHGKDLPALKYFPSSLSLWHYLQIFLSKSMLAGNIPGSLFIMWTTDAHYSFRVWQGHEERGGDRRRDILKGWRWYEIMRRCVCVAEGWGRTPASRRIAWGWKVPAGRSSARKSGTSAKDILDSSVGLGLDPWDIDEKVI